MFFFLNPQVIVEEIKPKNAENASLFGTREVSLKSKKEKSIKNIIKKWKKKYHVENNKDVTINPNSFYLYKCSITKKYIFNHSFQLTEKSTSKGIDVKLFFEQIIVNGHLEQPLTFL